MRLDAHFPGLVGTDYRITSPATDTYNCIAWAVGDSHNCWWPDPEMVGVWPTAVPRERTLDAFEAVFRRLGFEICTAEHLEEGFEKVAIFAYASGVPTHAARQLPDGRWASKLGDLEDIEHDLHAIEGDIYGTVVRLFRRPATITPS